jgi:hypothetical protein
MSHLRVDLDALSPAERRDLANALLRYVCGGGRSGSARSRTAPPKRGVRSRGNAALGAARS